MSTLPEKSIGQRAKLGLQGGILHFWRALNDFSQSLDTLITPNLWDDNNLLPTNVKCAHRGTLIMFFLFPAVFLKNTLNPPLKNSDIEAEANTVSSG